MALSLGFENIFPDAFWLNNNAVLPSYEQDRRIHFRREFELDSVPAEVRINITADARYTLFVNGQWVGHGPARGVQEMWPYDEIDIAGFLKLYLYICRDPRFPARRFSQWNKPRNQSGVADPGSPGLHSRGWTLCFAVRLSGIFRLPQG